MSNFFNDLNSVLQQDLASTIIPILVTDLQDVKANPADYINPATSPIKAIKLQADLLNALPTLEKSGVSDVAELLITYVQKIQQPAAASAAAAVTASTKPTA